MSTPDTDARALAEFAQWERDNPQPLPRWGRTLFQMVGLLGLACMIFGVAVTPGVALGTSETLLIPCVACVVTAIVKFFRAWDRHDANLTWQGARYRERKRLGLPGPKLESWWVVPPGLYTQSVTIRHD